MTEQNTYSKQSNDLVYLASVFKKLQLFKIESLLFGHYQNRIISVTPKAADELKGSENRSVAKVSSHGYPVTSCIS